MTDWARLTRCSPARCERALDGVARHPRGLEPRLEGSDVEILRSPREIAANAQSGIAGLGGALPGRPLFARRRHRRDRRGRRRSSPNIAPSRSSRASPAPSPSPPTTCISINEEVVHGIPGPRKLAKATSSASNGLQFERLVRRRRGDLRRRRDLRPKSGGCWTSPAKSGPVDRADGPAEVVERGRPGNGGLREETRILGGRGVCRPRHRPEDARRPAGAELRQPSGSAAAAISASFPGW